jgi:adenosylhomocysteine nucleosidase
MTSTENPTTAPASRRSRLWRVSLAILAAFLLAACAPARPVPATTPGDPRPGVDLVVQGAVDSELQPLLAALQGRETIQVAAWTFWRGRIGRQSVVVSRTEVGPINAVAATTLAIERFRPRLIINQGTAGATDPDLALFDIVAGEGTVDYGAFRSAPRAAGGGVDLAGWMPMPHRLRIDGKERVPFATFAGDAGALRVALETPYARGRVVKGVIGSAFEFNREIDRLAWVRKTYRAVSEDMESAYAGGTAAGFRTRFLAIRIISDSEFRAVEFQPIAGEHCAAFVLEVIKRLPDHLAPRP